MDAWNRARTDKSLINYGASAGHIPSLMIAMHEMSGALLPSGPASSRVPTDAEHRQSIELLRRGLDQGGLGIGLGIAYVKSTRAQILDVFRLAAERKVPVFVHMRSAGPQEPGAIDSLQEVLADAAAAGASLHVVHITSTCLRETPLCLQMIKGARSHGLDVDTECYPYTAGMTDLASAIFDPGWEQRMGGISFGDLQWAATGERLTAQTFARYRKQGGMVAVHDIPEEVVRAGAGRPHGDGGERRHPRKRERPSPQFRHVFARPRALCARRARAQPDGCNPQNDRDARRPDRDEEQRADSRSERMPISPYSIRAASPTTPRSINRPRLPREFAYVLVGGVMVVRDGKVVDGTMPGQAVKHI